MMNFSFGQNNQNFCGFDAEVAEKMKNPAYAEKMQFFELKIQEKIKENKLLKKEEELLIIPIVFHIFHKGEALGTGSNVPDSDIMTMLNRVNDFFRGRKAGTILDTKIEFQLAKRDPNCQATTGIVRHDFSGNADYVQFGYGSGQRGAKLQDILDVVWPGTDYLNYAIFSAVNGRAGPQGAGSALTDRKSITYTTIYNSFYPVHTDPEHELGHTLGLWHPHQGDGSRAGGGASTGCPADVTISVDSDGCDDTEVCVNDNDNKVDPSINHCTGQPWLNNYTSENMMSYFTENKLLTPDQKARIRAAVQIANVTRGNSLKDPETFVPLTPAIFTPEPAWRVSGQRGILSVELNGFKTTSIAAFLEEYLDLTQNCNTYYEVDGSTSHIIKVELPLPPNATAGHQLGVYIDWNNDGDFEDDNEFQFYKDEIHSPDGTSNPVVEVPIIYPTNIVNGSNVRMRLISDNERSQNFHGHINDTTKSAPGHFQPREGQTEDYMIKISSTLYTQDFGFENIKIFSDNTNKQIKIEGNLDSSTNIYLYDIQGRVLVFEKLNANASLNYIDTTSLSSGIYIVKIDDGQKTKSKKIIIN